MVVTHGFGIIDTITRKSYDEYEPEKYQCIFVDDEVVEDLQSPLLLVKTYFHSIDRPGQGLAYCGITLIPPESLTLFLDIMQSTDDLRKRADIIELSKKVAQAKTENKYMIHYGI